MLEKKFDGDADHKTLGAAGLRHYLIKGVLLSRRAPVAILLLATPLVLLLLWWSLRSEPTEAPRAQWLSQAEWQEAERGARLPDLAARTRELVSVEVSLASNTIRPAAVPVAEAAAAAPAARAAPAAPAATLTTKVPEKLAALRERAKATSEPTSSKPPVYDGKNKIAPIWKPSNTTPIYVSFSAFRDGSRCARTIDFALQKAKNYKRLHFRVMQAMDAAHHDVSCAEEFLKRRLPKFCKNERSCQEDILSRVKIWTIPLEQGMGPAHQRGLLNELLDYEAPDAFCITTDSHMDFHHNWDELTILDWTRTENEFAMLTAYPMTTMPNQDKVFANNHVDLCGYFLENGVPRGKTGGNLPTNPGDKPYFTMNWAAGLSFHRCHADRNVPVDKNLKQIFTGEEVSRAVRLWTSGYDLYLPSTCTVYHDYSAAKQEFWQFNQEARQSDVAASRLRLGSLLQLETLLHDTKPIDLGAYGLGKQRTLEQWVEWSRVDLSPMWRDHLASIGKRPVEGQTPEGGHDFCQTLKRVSVRNPAELHAGAKALGPVPGSELAKSPAKRVDLTLPAA